MLVGIVWGGGRPGNYGRMARSQFCRDDKVMMLQN